MEAAHAGVEDTLEESVEHVPGSGHARRPADSMR